jgi:hypothetical protein
MAVLHHRTDVDFHLNQLLRARVQNVTVLPTAAPENAGWLLYNTTDGQLYCSNGVTWTSSVATDVAYEHVQTMPQSVITVTHDLGFRPCVTAFSLDYGTQYSEFTTQHMDLNTLRVSMDNPQACVLVMS